MIGRGLAAAACFVASAWVVQTAWRPLGSGYFSDHRDSPDGVYFTVAGTGFAVAATLAALGLVVASDWFRSRGGLVVLAVLAVVASLLPAVLYTWTTAPLTWPWVFFADKHVGWFAIEPQPRPVGLLVQALLAAIVVVSLAVHLRTDTRPHSLR